MAVIAIVSFLVDLLQPYRSVLYPAFFVGFFAATLVALYYYRNRYVRSTYVAGFLGLLLVVNLAVPVHALPLVHWHKFSDPRPPELDWNEVRIVDENGRELVYDDKATLGVDGVTMEALEDRMRNEYTPEKNCQVVRWLVQRANIHRNRVADRPFHRWLRFPPHGLNNQWTSDDIHGYGTFVGIRIYELQVTTSSDGTAVTSYSEHLRFEHLVGGAASQDCPNGPTVQGTGGEP